MTAYRFSEFDGEEDAADDREAWFIARGVSPGRVELDAPEEES